jgi:acyl-CoA reductase-like NAD-dependent aldehyde dehydrogenase
VPDEAQRRTRSGVETIRTYAPATGELLSELAVTPDDEVRRVVGRARKAQAAWAILPVDERAHRLLRLRDALAERAEDLVECLSRECGKPRHEALLHEVAALLSVVTWCCKNASRALAPERVRPHLMKHRAGVVRFVPRGVVGVVSPSHWPLVIPMTSVVEALVTGNGCVVKPSEAAPLAMLEAKKIYDSTGLPEDLLGVVLGGSSTGLALVEAGIDSMTFSGSGQGGRTVAAACGARLVPCTMILGGKAPLIACHDCNLERTARAIVFGGFAGAGQLCVSVERVYAHETVYEPLLERVRMLVGDLRQGDPAREDVDLGPLRSPERVEAARRHVDGAVAQGARLVCGGIGSGRFFAPTVLGDCNHTMTVMREELFAPIVPFMKVASDDEAVALANDSHLGLNAYVFTSNHEHALRLADRIDAGSVIVNDVLSNYSTPEAPFGGIKQSGFGRVHGVESLRGMCHGKYVGFARIAATARDPFWYPYTSKSLRWLQRGVRLLYASGGVAKRIGELF